MYCKRGQGQVITVTAIISDAGGKPTKVGERGQVRGMKSRKY